MLARGRAGGLIRGTEFFTDRTITNVYARGVVSVVAEDDETLDVAPLVAQGVTSRRREAEPLFYQDVHLASDVANVRFGGSYGKGDAHHPERCTFERIGARDAYHTFVFDGTYDSRRHVVLDPVFIGGARYDDVWWRRTSAQSAYTVVYTLTIEGKAGESFEIRDAPSQPRGSPFHDARRRTRDGAAFRRGPRHPIPPIHPVTDGVPIGARSWIIVMRGTPPARTCMAAVPPDLET